MSGAREAQAEMRAILAGWRVTTDLEKAVACVQEAADAGDDEIAHSMQDELAKFALDAISKEGMPGSDAQAVAAAVLPVFALEFIRWCA